MATLSTHCVGTEPCPKCGSSDNVKVYDDGHKKCFSGGCTYWVPPDGAPSARRVKSGGNTDPAYQPVEVPSDKNWGRLDKRKIESKYLRAYGYFRANGEEQWAPYFDQGGNLVAYKVRSPGKVFSIRRLKPDDTSKPRTWQLFGRHVYGERFNRTVVVTAGELDALSIAQAVDMKIAVVSITGGDNDAVENCKQNWQWLNRFETIVLWFDDDESGRKERDAVARLFAVGKVKLARIEGFKDASDVTQAGRGADINGAIYAATTWRPRGIVNAADCLADILDDKAQQRGYDWPFEGLNKATTGVFPGGVTYVVAGTGIGKTTLLYETEYSLWRQGATIGIMGFEDMRRDVMLGLMTAHTSQRLALAPMNAMTKELMATAHKELFESGRIFLFDPETAEWTFEAIFGYIRYMAKALGCKVIVVDPLSFVAAGLGAHEDERRALDAASRDFAAMAKELGIHLIIAHHLKRIEGKAHEDGAQTSIGHLRGSGGIASFATLVIGLERAQQESEGRSLQDPMAVRILKNRKVGVTGVVDHLQYNPNTGRLEKAEKTATSSFNPTESPFDEE